jgi:hypothetical protein
MGSPLSARLPGCWPRSRHGKIDRTNAIPVDPSRTQGVAPDEGASEMEPVPTTAVPSRTPWRAVRGLYALAYTAALVGIVALKAESKHIEATLDGAKMLLVSWGWTLPLLTLLAVWALLRYRTSLPPRTRLTTFVVLVALLPLLPTAGLCYLNRAFASAAPVERFAVVTAKHRVVQRAGERLSLEFAVGGSVQSLTVPAALYDRVAAGERIRLSLRKGGLGYWYVSGIDRPAEAPPPPETR